MRASMVRCTGSGSPASMVGCTYKNNRFPGHYKIMDAPQELIYAFGPKVPPFTTKFLKFVYLGGFRATLTNPCII